MLLFAKNTAVNKFCIIPLNENTQVGKVDDQIFSFQLYLHTPTCVMEHSTSGAGSGDGSSDDDGKSRCRNSCAHKKHLFLDRDFNLRWHKGGCFKYCETTF